MIQFQKASKAQSKLRCALFGPSGSGKTFSALRMAKGMAGDEGKIVVIDTEFGSASKYADRFDFDTLRLDDNPTPAQIGDAIRAADNAGYTVLIIDSMTHAWEELKRQVERISKTPRYSGNYWAAWSEGTPMQKEFVRTILGSKCHIIATMRVKTHWDVEKDSQGKGKPVRKGLDPEQGKGIEYEFDMLLQLSTDHVASVDKDRTGKFQDKVITCPDEDFGRELALWLSEGVPVPDEPAPKNAADQAMDAIGEELGEPERHEALIRALNDLIKKHELTGMRRVWLEHFKVRELTQLTVEQLEKLVAGITAKYGE